MNTESIIKVSILTQHIDVNILINEDLDFDESDNLLPHYTEIINSITTTTIEIAKEITMDKTNKTLDNNQFSNQFSNPISNTHKIINSILELYRKYGNTIVSQHKTKIGLNTELIYKSLLQYSLECVLNTCNSHDIIFYNDNDRNLISTIAFLSNLGFILLNANKNKDVQYNIIANPYKLASVYLKNIGMPDTICYLVEHILEIKIYNSRKANNTSVSAGVNAGVNASMSDYYYNQLECVKTVIDSNDLGNDLEYNADNFKDIEKLENFELLMAIDKCMSEHVGHCRENEIDLYLYGFIKPKMIGVMG
jgi:hypothetical protein